MKKGYGDSQTSSLAQGLDFDSYMKELLADRAGFNVLAGILKSDVGINLPETDKNLSLMSSRLNKLMLSTGVKNFSAFARVVKSDPQVKFQFVEQMTTNTTYFFREKSHYEMLKNCVSQCLASQKSVTKELRVWCAASSSGQEPYCILITLIESFGWPLPFNLKFLATDISIEMLNEASTGVYTAKELESLSSELKEKYFKPLSKPIKGTSGVDSVWRKEYQGLIRFAQFNLLSQPYPFRSSFDIVFCRNVLIYFERQTVKEIIDKIVDRVSPGGFLFLGHSESGMMQNSNVKTVGHAAYEKKG